MRFLISHLCFLCLFVAYYIGVEHMIEGTEPVQLDRDLLVIPVPGHTRGHVVYLYRDKFLFTGDHLAWSPRRQTLTAFSQRRLVFVAGTNSFDGKAFKL